MNRRKVLALVTRREMRARILSRPFLISLVVTSGLIFAIFGLGDVLGGSDAIQIGLVGVQPDGAETSLRAIAEFNDTEVEFTELDSRTDAEMAVAEGEIDAAIVDGAEIIMDRLNGNIIALATPAWQQAQLVDELDFAGLSNSQIERALTNASPLRVTELNPDINSDARESVAFATVILLFIAVQVSGAYIMMGVFEEKTTRVVELVLSSVPARYLLAGKVLGIGVLGVIQVTVLAGSAVAAASLFGSSALPALSTGLIGTGILWFLLGYLLYGSVFAAGASLAPRQEDAQSTLAPISVILMISYFISIFVASDPTSLVARIVSWIPMTAPFTMPGRIATGDAQWWEVAGSMIVTAITGFAVLLLAERIYVRSIIHTDRKLGWREAWRLRD